MNCNSDAELRNGRLAEIPVKRRSTHLTFVRNLRFHQVGELRE